jgi:hypothetical protein
MSELGLVSRVTPVQTALRNCTGDEGRPFGFGDQGRALAESGCSTKEIQAILGHRTAQMVELYSKAARQKKLARAAIAKLERTGTELETPKLRQRVPNDGGCE